MPDYKTDKAACEAKLPSTTHDHHCHGAKGHMGRHACYCGIRWDDEGKISILKTPRRRR